VSRAAGGPPRSTWLAVGTAAGAAWVWAGLPTVAALVAGLVVLAAGLAVRGMGRGVGVIGIASGLGAALLAIRVALGPGAPPTPPLPVGSGPWTATVDSVGSPRDGNQTARLSLLVDPGPVQVAATLPAYPVVRSGATVEVSGRLQPPPDDDPYGEIGRASCRERV